MPSLIILYKKEQISCSFFRFVVEYIQGKEREVMLW